jgi:hypothetical protein
VSIVLHIQFFIIIIHYSIIVSAEGNNKFSGKIIANDGDKNLVKVDSPFVLKNLEIFHVITIPRQKGNFNNVNIYYIPDEFVGNFDDVDKIIEKLTFIAIGSY